MSGLGFRFSDFELRIEADLGEEVLVDDFDDVGRPVGLQNPLQNHLRLKNLEGGRNGLPGARAEGTWLRFD